MFDGLRPGVVGLLASAALVLMNSENFGSDTYSIITSVAIFASVFVASHKYKVNPILLIVLCGIAGFILY